MIIKSLNKIKQYWKKCADSMHCNMSRGAENLSKTITSAHGDGWRRRCEGSRRAHNNHKKSK